MRRKIAQGFGSGILGLCLTIAASGTSAAQQCVGDCNGDGAVQINELIVAVNIALGSAPLSACSAFDCDCGPFLALPPGICCGIDAVNNALNGCSQPPPTPGPPHLALNLQINDLPDQHQVDIVATLDHLGGSMVSYVEGCTAECYPVFLTAIAFELTGPEGTEVFLTAPCGFPAECAEHLESLSSGQSVEQTLSVTGTAWKRQQSEQECGTCTQVPLADGQYVVTATFAYRIGSDWSVPVYTLQQTAEFDWPLGGTPTPAEGVCGPVCDNRPCGEYTCPGENGQPQPRFCDFVTAAGCECSPVECPTPPPTPQPSATPTSDCAGVPDGAACVGPCGVGYCTASHCSAGPCEGACGTFCLASQCVANGCTRTATATLTPTAPMAFSTPTPTPTLDPVEACGLVENVGGCCDFEGAKPCYQLGQFGDSAAMCMHTDGGFPRGCYGSVVCNASTGLCEDTTPIPTPTCPSLPPPTCAPGDGLTCGYQQCASDCRCGTVTPTPTLTTPIPTTTPAES